MVRGARARQFVYGANMLTPAQNPQLQAIGLVSLNRENPNLKPRGHGEPLHRHDSRGDVPREVRGRLVKHFVLRVLGSRV